MRFALPYPPSVNTYWRHPSSGKLAGRHLISERGRAYREQVARAVRVAQPLAGRLAVSIIAHMPDRRRRDLDNLPKGVLDALTHAGVWLDDSQIDLLSVLRAGPVTGGMLVVEINAMETPC